MTIPIDMAAARIRAESLMGSTCEVRARDGGTTMDPNSGTVSEAPGTLHYEGKCRVRPAGGGGTVEVGGQEMFTFTYLVSLPFDAADVAEGYRVKITDSPDPALVSVVVEVQKVDRGDNVTTRRLYCREVN